MKLRVILKRPFSQHQKWSSEHALVKTQIFKTLTGGRLLSYNRQFIQQKAVEYSWAFLRVN